MPRKLTPSEVVGRKTPNDSFSPPNRQKYTIAGQQLETPYQAYFNNTQGAPCSEARFLNKTGRLFLHEKGGTTQGNSANALGFAKQLHCVEQRTPAFEPELASSPQQRFEPKDDAVELDEEIVQRIVASKPGYSAEEVRRGAQDPNSKFGMLYSKLAEESKALMAPVHPSYVPSIISSLNSTSAGGSLKKNFFKGTMGLSDCNSTNPIEDIANSTLGGTVNLEHTRKLSFHETGLFRYWRACDKV